MVCFCTSLVLAQPLFAKGSGDKQHTFSGLDLKEVTNEPKELHMGSFKRKFSSESSSVLASADSQQASTSVVGVLQGLV